MERTTEASTKTAASRVRRGARRAGTSLLFGTVALLALLTIASWFAQLHPYIEVATTVQAQMLIVACIAMVAAAATRKLKLAVVALLVACVQMVAMVPYWTATAPVVADGAPVAQVLQYNLFFHNHDYDAIADLINSSPAVVVGLHEITDEQWNELEPRLTTHPYNVAVPVSQDVGQLGGGMALLSRSPLTQVTIDSPSNLRARPILAAQTEVLGQPTMIIGLHPYAARFDLFKARSRAAQLDAVTQAAVAADGPVIVVTDMNITPHSPDYTDFIDRLGWQDPHRLVGWNATWPSFGGALGLPIDHVLVSNDFVLHDYEVGPAAGSDHLSLQATISLAPDA